MFKTFGWMLTLGFSISVAALLKDRIDTPGSQVICLGMFIACLVAILVFLRRNRGTIEEADVRSLGDSWKLLMALCSRTKRHPGRRD